MAKRKMSAVPCSGWRRLHPDLVIVDISLKDGHGIELIKQIKARHGQLKMLVVSMYNESLYGERALRAGALGFLNKQESRAADRGNPRRPGRQTLYQQPVNGAVGLAGHVGSRRGELLPRRFLDQS